MSHFSIRILPTLQTNYVFLIHDQSTRVTVCIDPGDDPSIASTAKEWGWPITHILITHPHYDHMDGISALVDEFNCEVYGSRHDFGAIPRCDFGVLGGDVIACGPLNFKVMDIPGHTKHHIAFYMEHDSILFTGDTLFSLGCGRLLGGTAVQLFESLNTIKALPKETQIYFTHEYTQDNAKFALSVDGDNEDLKARAKEVDSLRADGLATVPVTVSSELKCNPFLRCESVEAFAKLRLQKDHF